MEFDREYRRLMLEFSEGAIRKIVQKFQNDASEQEIRREIQDFEKYKQSLQKKDPFQYKSWIEFTEAIHAAKGKSEFKKKKAPSQEITANQEDIIADDENVTIYRGDSQDKCVMYGKGYSFCISRPTGGNMFSSYRLREKATFYFIYFKKKSKSENDHIMVLDHNNDGYKWTFADNDTQPVEGGWNEIVSKYPELSRYKDLLVNKKLDDSERNLIDRIDKFARRPILDIFNKFSYKEKLQALKSVINLPDDIWKTLDLFLRNEFLSVGPNLTPYQADDLKPNEIERYKKTRDISTTILMDDGNFQKNAIDSKYNETYKKIEKEQHDMILNMANKYKNGNFDISHKKIYSLPDISWLRISGNFYGSENNLTSLEGMPKYVERTCSVSSNNLKNLKGSPEYVGGDFRFDDNDILSLEGSPDYVGGSFVGSSYSLTSLKGSPKKIEGNFTLLKSPNLSTLDGISPHIGGYISVDNFSEEDARDYMADLPKSNYSEFGDISSALNKLKFKESKIQIESFQFDKEYRLWLESFDTVSDFMINPEHSKKPYDEIFKEFKKSGGKNIGYGAFGLVYYHPKWPYVLKTFKSDDAYLKFVRYAYDHPHPSFPKFYGKPQRVSPKIQSINDKRYLVRIEKLKPISEKIFDKIDTNLFKYFKLIHNPDNIYDNSERSELINMRPKIQKLSKKIINLLEGLYFIKRDLDLQTDLHSDNVMVRNDGQYVWVDPVMEGGWLEEREDSLMTPETFHLLQQRINKINSKLKNVKVGLEVYDENIYDIKLNQKIDISTCGIVDYEGIIDNSDEILEMFGDDELSFELINLNVKNGILNMDFVTDVGYNNVKFGMNALDEILDYLKWVEQEIKPNICERLHEIIGNYQESFQFDKEYQKILNEYTSQEGEGIVDLLKSKYKNRRIILTSGDFVPKDNPIEKQITHNKPAGSWYSLGEYWARWMSSEKPDWFSSYDKIYMLDLNYSNILRINNGKKMEEFQKKYGVQPYKQYNDFTMMIDWKQVAQDYSGIEIIPMIWQGSRDWYRTWDIPSGCVWDSSAIKGWKEIRLTS